MKPVYLLTGKPGAGKTSLIKQALAEAGVKAGGFYTGEIRNGGIRLGFRLVALDGREATLAHVDFNKRFRVGKYGVDVSVMEKTGVPALREAAKSGSLIVIDEIGKMEILAAEFREAVSEIIGSGKPVLGTIMLQPNPFTDDIKRRPEVNVAALTRENYQKTLEDVLLWLKAITNAVPRIKL